MGSNKGMKYITNGVIQTMIKPGDEMPEGFHFGKLPVSEKTRKILSESHKGIKPTKESIEKMKKTFVERYGVTSPSLFPGVGEKISEKLSSEEVQEKMKKTCLEKYGVEHCLQSDVYKEKMRETMYEKYGDRNYNNKEKEYETRKKNGTLGLFETRPEKELYTLLVQEFGEEDVYKQYRTSEYPFKADFYIKSLDCYIEYHGYWMHNNHPFDSTNENDLKIVEEWKAKGYDVAVSTWTDLDIRKASYKNKVNLIIYYPDVDKQEDIVYSFMKIKAELDQYKK